jgi:RimJ/RimL family protein N-acetyltransferase
LPGTSGRLYGREVTYGYWPLFDLRLSVPGLRLRPMTEADLAPLADLMPGDVEQDPGLAGYDVGDPRTARGIVSHQAYWRAYGTWRPGSWRLSFVVRTPDGEILGVQELEGNDFPTLRTVDSSSWLVTAARGRGLGKQMRTAVLALAFGPLEAQAAITSAWHDNHASLGVSRALGYRPNGESLHAHPGRVDVLKHLRLPRADWLASGLGEQVEITGFGACLPLFGLPGR